MQRSALGQCAGQRAAEGVAGGGGVHRRDRQRRDDVHGALGAQQCAVRAQGDHHGRRSAEGAGRVGDGVQVRQRAPDQGGQFPAVGHQYVDHLQQSARQLPRGRGVEQHQAAGQPGRRLHGRGRDLLLEQGDLGVAEQRPRRRAVLGRERAVGAGADDDRVLAGGGVHRHQRLSAGRSLGHQHPLHIDPLRGQRRPQPPADRVRTDHPHHRDLGSEPRRRDRLVGALAARVLGQGTAQHGLPRPGVVRDRYHQVQVEAAHDCDLRHGTTFADGRPRVHLRSAGAFGSVQPLRTACITARATGAARPPPLTSARVALLSSITTATATGEAAVGLGLA